MQIDTTINVWRESEQFIAHAMPIDVASAGLTADDARKALSEALELFVSTARDAGTLDELLDEVGYEQINGVEPICGQGHSRNDESP